MSRVYAIESTPTLLGAKADHRLRDAPGRHRARRCATSPARSAPDRRTGPQQDGPPLDWLKAAAADLQRATGQALVHAGPRAAGRSACCSADAINGALGAFGKTVGLDRAGRRRRRLAAAVPRRARRTTCSAGKVDTLLILGANPVYDAPADLDFAARAAARAVLGQPRRSTTTRRRSPARGTCPRRTNTKRGATRAPSTARSRIQQPQVAAALRRPFGAAAACGAAGRRRRPTTTRWCARFWQARAQQRKRGDFEAVLARGAAHRRRPRTARAAPVIRAPRSDLAAAAAAAADQQRRRSVAALPPRRRRSGTAAMPTMPWLLEMARPFTRLTWDNAALIAPATAKRLGLEHARTSSRSPRRHEACKRRSSCCRGRRRIASRCRSASAGSAGGLGAGVGLRCLPRCARATTHGLPTAHPPQNRRAPTDSRPTQGHDRVLGRDLVREGTLQQFNDDPHFAEDSSARTSRSIPRFEYPDRAWAMAIDLNSCIGCQACTVACQAENNVPVVGKDQVLDQRVMHWLRIDRYYSGSARRARHRLRAGALHALRERALRGRLPGRTPPCTITRVSM